MMDVDRDDAGGGTGSARRRRERRLRAYLRYARMSVAMALAESTHHSAPRGQKMARAGGGARDELHGYAPEDAPPQGRSLRHFVGHLPAPSLDVPVLQMVDQLVDVFRFFDTLCPVAEQVIDVPKIFLDDIPARRLCREPQLVEQLVEVPTVISYSSLRRTMVQHVDIPVPRRGGRSTGLQGFLPGQSSTASSSSSKKRISERTVEQNVRFPGEGLQDFRPGQVSPASSSFHSPAGSDDDANEPGDGVFRSFPQGKKVRSAGQVSADLPRHISSWTPAAYEQSRGSHEHDVAKEKKKAEYERRMMDINQRVADGLLIGPKEYEAWRRYHGLPPSSSYSSGKRRKRKKRSKKKLPKSSSSLRLSPCSSRCVPSCCRLQACDARHHGRFGPDEQLCRLWWHAWLVLLVTVHFALCFLPCLLARDARHHGRYGPEGILRVPVQKTADFRSCSSSTRSLTFLFVPLEQIPMVQAVQQTTEIPQMPFVFRSSMPLLCTSCDSTDSSPYTAHCLVRLRIQVLSQSTGYFVFLREFEDYGS